MHQEQGRIGPSPNPLPLLMRLGVTHTDIGHSPGLPLYVWLFICSPFPSGRGQLINAFSCILSGGRWEDRQAARKSWWLLNGGFEDLFISD